MVDVVDYRRQVVTRIVIAASLVVIDLEIFFWPCIPAPAVLLLATVLILCGVAVLNFSIRCRKEMTHHVSCMLIFGVKKESRNLYVNIMGQYT